MYFRSLAALLSLLTVLASAPALAATLRGALALHAGPLVEPRPVRQRLRDVQRRRTRWSIWYTFDASNNPVWYTAQGELGACAVAAAEAPLGERPQRRVHRGRHAAHLTLRAPEPRRRLLQHRRPGGHVADPALRRRWRRQRGRPHRLVVRPGQQRLGLTSRSRATCWAACSIPTTRPARPPGTRASTASNGSVAMIGARCLPGVPLPATATQPAGRLTFEFPSESETRAAQRAHGRDGGGRAPRRRARRSQLGRRPLRAPPIASSPRCAMRAADVLAIGMTALPARGRDRLLPAPAASSYSSTNLQEAGVDEADTVKTDGRYIYTFTRGTRGWKHRALASRRARRPGRVDRGAAPCARGPGPGGPAGALPARLVAWSQSRDADYSARPPPGRPRGCAAHLHRNVEAGQSCRFPWRAASTATSFDPPDRRPAVCRGALVPACPVSASAPHAAAHEPADRGQDATRGDDAGVSSTAVRGAVIGGLVRCTAAAGHAHAPPTWW